jgi:hypothetical protein
MKLNKILMVLASTAIVGCTSEDLNDFNANQAPEDSRMIQLDPNFAIAGVGEGDAITRTHWDNEGGKLVNKFLPILTGAYAADEVLDTKVDKLDQAVGLCWLGQTPGAEVYTNYQFYHFGWLKQGESSPTLECNKLTNGAWYDEIKFTAAGGAAGEEPLTTNFAWNGGVVKDFTIDKLNYNSGVYKTDNKSIFGGDYIVYYPFNEDFDEVGTIPAKAVTSFDKASNNFRALYLGDATFRYSKKIKIDGGAKAGGFGLHNLSALVNLKVKGTSGGNIDKIVLWSKKEQLLEQANLAADKILAGKEGKDLYAETKGTKTIVATLATPAAASTGSDVNTYITALPTKVEDLVAYVHRVDGKWAKITLNEVEFLPNSGKTVNINVTNGDFKTQYIAVDNTSFQTALLEAAGKTATIEVIGDITLEANTTINEPNITIKGDKIIVPEDITLTLNTKMESDLRILGKACCGTAIKGGRVEVQGGKLGNVTMEPTAVKEVGDKYDDYNPEVKFTTNAAEIAAGKTFDAQAGNVKVDAAVAHKANINIAEKVKLTVSGTGDLNFMGSTVVNNGTIEVEKVGKFDITDKDGNASATDGKNMTNNGKFIHNVDAQVGTAVQLMTMNEGSEYRCRVDKQIKLDDAYQKWTACSVIEMVGAGQIYNLGVAEKNIEYKHNGKYIDIEVNTTSATTFNNPDLGSGDGDNKNIQVGKLTVMQGGLYVPYVTGKGKRELTVNGDMTVSKNASLYSSKKITVKENLIVNSGATLKYWGEKKNEGGLAVEKDIKVSGATFDAFVDKVDALDITCANFTLASSATAIFGNRTEGDTKNLTVSGTITNPAGCTFNIKEANQVGGSVLATITCTKLIVGGAFPGGKPQVVAAE